jgi:hypothetical protein
LKKASSLSSLVRDYRVLLGLLLFGGLLVRVWFAQDRWINADEGAHLMDALLVLKGYVPIADYEARQPFYVYVLAGFLRLFGTSIVAARTYPIVTSVAIGGLVYLIGTQLFDRRVGLLAAAGYLFMPFSIAYGTHAKTEPLTILLSCAAIYIMLVALDRRRNLLLVLSGVALACAYYARQSSLGVTLAVGIILLLRIRRPVPLLRAGMGLLGGYLVVFTVMIAAFTTVLPLQRVLHSPLNPLDFVTTELTRAKDSAVRPFVRDVVEITDDEGVARVVPEDQPWDVTMYNVRRTLRLNSVLLVALALSPWLLLFGGGVEDKHRKFWAAITLYAWVGGVAFAYTYWALRRGFFPAYFGELIPPLVILGAAVGIDALTRLSSTRSAGWRDVALFGAIGLVTVTGQVVLGPEAINRPLYFVLAALVLGTAYLTERFGRREITTFLGIAGMAAGVILLAGHVALVARLSLYGLLFVVALALPLRAAHIEPRRDLARAGAFLGLTVLTGTAALWLGASQTSIDRRFDGIWSPATVEAVAAYVEEVSDPDDRVLSGAVVWEFTAGREPFMRISHPLLLRKGISDRLHRAILAGFEDRPPAIVVLDGYTEQTYLRVVPELKALIDEHYRLAREFAGARYPVQVYTLSLPPADSVGP